MSGRGTLISRPVDSITSAEIHNSEQIRRENIRRVPQTKSDFLCVFPVCGSISYFSARHQSERKEHNFQHSKMNVCWGKTTIFQNSTNLISRGNFLFASGECVRKQETGFLKWFWEIFFRLNWSVRLKKELIISHYVSKRYKALLTLTNILLKSKYVKWLSFNKYNQVFLLNSNNLCSTKTYK